MTDAHVVGDMRQQRSRPAAELPVVVSDAVNKVVAGFRLGETGAVGADAFLRADLLFEVGETLELQIELPDGGAMVARGRVLRIERGRAGEPLTGMAIALVDLSASNRAALEAALR